MKCTKKSFERGGFVMNNNYDLEFHDELITLADDLYNDCRMTEHGIHVDKVWIAE